MRTFAARRKVVSHTMQLDAPPSKVFPLLCPVREYEWIEIWDCTMLYTESGVAEEDCVFVIDFVPGHPPDTFYVSRYEKDRQIQFVRTDGLRMIRQRISLAENGDGTTTAVWTQVLTGLNPEGNDVVAGMTDERYRQEVTTLEKMLSHFLATGECLRLSEVGGTKALLGTENSRA